ncbi:MAG: large-conductance mechanosensitive channel protein MscL [Bacteroidetes bacterium]|nr:large-conductance mechanosensitive channel protein MscL [Bacteroidota bacterium]MBU1114522.1 large-conductance mechanosensitive channel protein MscL [Bacteroidota bacterium]MBU1799706.1 large-conductance mechanosensitive channel protein MscL [Bacteroidota bacterium]
MLKEFKAFAMKGNVVDLAVAVIIGGAFGKIVASFISNIVMPPIGLLLGGVDFTDLVIILKDATETNAAVTIDYGIFIGVVLDFLIIAFIIFMAIKGINSLKKKEEVKPVEVPKTAEDILLLREIRDLLQK